MAQRYCVKKGTAQGAEVVYRPRSEQDRFPWEVDSRWYPGYNGWRYGPDSVTTIERYREQSRVQRGNVDPQRV